MLNGQNDAGLIITGRQDVCASIDRFDLQLFNEPPAPPEPTPPAGPPPAESTPPTPAPAPAPTPPDHPAPPAPPEPPAPPADPLDAVPEKYDFKLKDGFKIDESLEPEIQGFLKENKLTQRQANSLIDIHTKYMERQMAAVEEWDKAETAKTEQYLGQGVERAAKEEAIGLGKSALDPSGELMALLDAHHLGGSLVVAKVFESLGKRVKEGTFVPASSAQGEKSWKETMYGDKL